MSGTSSTQPPIPPEAWSAPLTPEQRKAYAEIGAALEAGDGIRIDSTKPTKFTNCTAHISDAQMLDWVLEHRAQIIHVHDELPVYAHYWTTAGKQYGPDAATPRDAVLAAMKKEQPK